MKMKQLYTEDSLLATASLKDRRRLPWFRRPIAILAALSLLLATSACESYEENPEYWWIGGGAAAAVIVAIVALSGGGDSDSSNGNGNGNEGTPGAPTSLAATTAADDQIDLSWEAPADNGGSDIGGYRIEYRQGSGDWMDAAANTESTDTEYEHSGLTAATQYSYRVSAINANGTGPASEVAMATTAAMGAMEAPDAPTSLMATSAVADDQIDLSWTAPADDGGSAITGYRIEYREGSGDWTDAEADTGSTDTEYAHTDLTAGAQYSYRVSAINANGTGPVSNEAMATSGDIDGDGVINSMDVDDDNDGLIEIASRAELSNIRHNLAGSSYDDEANDGAGNEGAIIGAPTAATAHCDTAASIDGSDIFLCGYELIANIDLGGTPPTSLSNAFCVSGAWTPIGGCGSDGTCGESSGNDDNPFTAILEGNGFTISNLCVAVSTNRINVLGLFGHLGGATVRNLLIEEFYIRSHFTVGNLSSVNDNNRLGALAGYVTGDTVILSVAVSDSDSDIDLRGTTTNDNQYVGGLVGNQLSGSITASYATGAADGGAGGSDSVGGLVGEQHGGGITASYATGAVDGGAGFSDSVGGLVGRQDGGSITASYGFGTATGGTENRIGNSETATVSPWPSGVTSAAGLTADNAGAGWSTDVWDFGTSSQAPALKYVDGYDSTATPAYSCADSSFPASLMVTCGTTLLPGQR